MLWSTIASDALLLTSLMGIIYLLVAIREVRRFGRRPATHRAARPPVTILKPLCGDEPDLYENLRSFCEQGLCGNVQVVFGARQASDPAIPIVRRLIREFPERDLTLVVNERVHGTNLKVSNLQNMREAARHDVLVIADSDVRVGPGYLETVVEPLSNSGVGLVTCLYAGRAERGLWSRLAAMFVNHAFVPSVLVAERIGVRVGCFGATMALRRETLDSVGGLAPFQDLLADDHALGAVIRATWRQVILSPYVVDMVVAESGVGTLCRHELRWLRTVRSAEPFGHAGLLITHPVALAAVAVPLSGGSWLAWGILGIALGCRLALARVVNRVLCLPHSAPGFVLVRDLLSFGLFMTSFFGKEVAWRRHRFTLQPDGALALHGDAANDEDTVPAPAVLRRL